MDRPLAVEVGGGKLAVFRHEENAYAVTDRCPHMDYPLSEGRVREGMLICTLHHWKFPLAEAGTEDEQGPRYHPTRIRDGRVEVQLPLSLAS